MFETNKVFNIPICFIRNKFYEKRRIIQDLYFLGKVSDIRELKDFTFFNFNAEIAINIGGDNAVGTHDCNARTNHRLIVFINHSTRYLKLFGIYTTGEQYEYV